ncbi:MULTISPECIES: SSI family serine proteinase inhibitor [Streptomyces]|uniref:SSI family serine proteinase inhibitor n=1 Tax=Streptomyces TaxID=1883 RepID=UPI0004BEEF1F|nr:MULTISPECIES: SSI family serine proteinase inhibitor [Streptomyces]KPC96829.1 hypothetical protein ADL27_00350 [Streptomyces sp. NRRL F-6602]
MSRRTVHSVTFALTLTSLAATLLSLAGAPKEAFAEGRGGESSRPADKLTFDVSGSGSGRDGSYTLRCHPAGGDHPAPVRACAALDRATSGGRDPFTPVAADATCTMIYGGPATARVTGTWHGRDVDARFGRDNGCEVARWNSLVPALPKTA